MYLTECERGIFYCRRTYVVWRSFEKISAGTAEKVFGKKLDTIVVVHCYTEGAHITQHIQWGFLETNYNDCQFANSTGPRARAWLSFCGRQVIYRADGVWALSMTKCVSCLVSGSITRNVQNEYFIFWTQLSHWTLTFIMYGMRWNFLNCAIDVATRINDVISLLQQWQPMWKLLPVYKQLNWSQRSVQ